MRQLYLLFAIPLLFLLGTGLYLYSGAYPIAADQPHWALTSRLLSVLRERAIDRGAATVTVPSLDDPALIRAGASRYAQMCGSCHLSPALRQTELREGLYPQPPDLYSHGVSDPARAFWVIKHGIKLTAMPAWGRSHDDTAIWQMVAFLQQLPRLDEAGFEALAGMPANDGHGGAHHHPHGAAPAPADDHDHDAMPGMQMGGTVQH